MGPQGSGRVHKGSGGSEGTGGFRRVRKGQEGSKMVSEGPGGSKSVQKGPGEYKSSRVR